MSDLSQEQITQQLEELRSRVSDLNEWRAIGVLARTLRHLLAIVDKHDQLKSSLREAIALLTTQGVGVPSVRGEYGWHEDSEWLARRDALEKTHHNI